MTDKILHKAGRIRNILRRVTDLIMEGTAPDHCLVCGNSNQNKQHRYDFICDDCLLSMPPADAPSVIINRLVGDLCPDEISINSVYGLFSANKQNNYLNLIHDFKYFGRKHIAFELGKLLGRYVNTFSDTNYDIIIPIPIHHARERERGYNQARLISDGINAEIEIPVSEDIIKRNRYTGTQTKLKAHERRMNLKEAFSPVAKNINLFEKNILLVDDVFTTGSTLNTAAACLLGMGAKLVEVAVLGVA
jgi:ComF family protein